MKFTLSKFIYSNQPSKYNQLVFFSTYLDPWPRKNDAEGSEGAAGAAGAAVSVRRDGIPTEATWWRVEFQSTNRGRLVGGFNPSEKYESQLG